MNWQNQKRLKITWRVKEGVDSLYQDKYFSNSLRFYSVFWVQTPSPLIWLRYPRGKDRTTLPLSFRICFQPSLWMPINVKFTASWFTQLEQNKSYVHTASTFAAVFADVSIKTNPFSWAKSSPSFVLTARLCSKSDLLPMSMMVMLGLPFCRASSSHRVRWLKLSRRVMSYTRSAPAASR